MPIGFDRSVVYGLRLQDETERDAKAALLRLQRDVDLGSVSRGKSEVKIAELLESELKLMREILQMQLAISSAEKTRAGRSLSGQSRDPLGKKLGGARGLGIENFDDLIKSFTTLEGLKARTLSLFAGQIGTLSIYGGAVGIVSAGLKELVSSQAAVQEKTAQLGIVLDSEQGKLQADLRATTLEARLWALGHGQAVAEIIQAEYDLAAAGLRVVDIQTGIMASSLLAEGGLLDLGKASEIVVAGIQTFAREGITPIEVATQLQAVAASTATNITELGTAFKYSAATAETADIPFKDLVATLGTLGTLGLRGSTGGTALNQFLVNLIAKQDQLRQFGIVITDTEGRLKPLVEIIGEFQKKFGSFVSPGEQKILQELFNTRGARAIERLLADTTVLPKVLKEVQDSEVEVFRAAEQGSNTLTEASKVLGNQLLDVLLANGGVASALQSTFDSFTNRTGLRAVSNLQVSAAGVRFELEQLEEAQKLGGVAALDWSIDLLRAAKTASGPVASELRKLQKQFDELSGGLQGKQGPQIDLPTQTKFILEQAEKLARVQEDILKGGNIFESLFGKKPVVPISADFAQSLQNLSGADLSAQFQGAADLAKGLIPFADTEKRKQELSEFFDFFSAKARDAVSDADVAVVQSRNKFAQEIAEANIRLAKAEIGALESAGANEFDKRRELAKKRQAFELSVVNETLKKELDALLLRDSLDKETHDHIETLKSKATQEAEKQRTRIRNESSRENKDIALAELEFYYGNAKRIRDLQLRLDEDVLPERTRLIRQRESQLEDLRDFTDKIARELEQGLIDLPTASQKLEEAGLQFGLDDRGRENRLRALNRKIGELNQEATVEEAQQLLLRSQGFERFNAQKELAELKFTQEFGRIETDRTLAAEDKFAQQLVAWSKMQTEMTQIDVAETAARKELLTGFLDSTAEAFSGISKLAAIEGHELRGKLTADLAASASAAARVISLIDKAAGLGTAGAISAGLGIVGTLASLAAGIFDRNRDEEKQVERLADEFRHQEGRNVSPDFGRAQVFNTQVLLSPTFSLMTAPTASQQKFIVNELLDEIIDGLEEQGVINVSK